MMLKSLLDFLNLIGDCVRQMVVGFGNGRLVLLGAVLCGILFYYLCHKSTKLWNRRFQVRFSHHFYCGFSALSAFLAVLLYASSPFLKPVARALIEAWKLGISHDRGWSDETFDQAKEAVMRLGTEPKDSFVDKIIPLNKPASRYKLASVYCNSASQHFARQHPILNRLIRPDPSVPESSVVQDVNDFFAKNTGVDAKTGRTPNYPIERTIDLVAQMMRDDLEKQVPQIVTRARNVVVAVFAVAQAISFWGIGRAAARDVRVQI